MNVPPSGGRRIMRISIIIPVLNEAGQIGQLISRTRQTGADEIIVVDGGSSDGTPAAAAGADRVLSGSRGRARQQNAGAAAAEGDVLVFLHADCRLPAEALRQIEAALADPRCIGGCFRQQIDAAGVRYRLLEAGNAWRVRALGWAYGDQGVFLRREVFEAVGGFPDVPFMEDLYLMKRLKSRGRFVLLPARLEVSARRWQQTGVVRQTMRNWRSIALAHLGVPLEKLAAAYTAVR
jgi:rSAM/selenodomain-associated transferase 2